MKQTIRIGKRTIRYDFGFLLIMAVLFFTSIFALYNSFNLVANGAGSYYLRRQIMWYAVGFAVMILISRTQNKVLFQYIKPVYQFLMAILIYLLLSKLTGSLFGFSLPLASPVNGAYSWLQIPFIGSFQASEFMKVVLIIKTAQIISAFQKRYPNPDFKQEMQMFVQIGKWALPPMLLILLEPDTGVFIIITFTLMVLILCSGIRKIYFWILLGMIAVAFGGFFYLYFFQNDFLRSIVSGYQLNRIDAWLHPEDHIQGISNQLYTALLSLGSAGLTGHGLQASIISIPEAHTDFIFAAFGQCFGLLGTVYILIVCMWLDLYICRLAYNTRSQTSRLIMIGAVAMLLYQQFQNLGMIVGLVPITGITLPLISYGGSSSLSYFILFGIILNASPVSAKTRRVRSFKEIREKLSRTRLKKKAKPLQS